MVAAILAVPRLASTGSSLLTVLYVISLSAGLIVILAGLRAYYRKSLGEALDAKAQRRIDGYKADNDQLAARVVHLQAAVAEGEHSLELANARIDTLERENASFRTLNGAQAWEALERILVAQNKEVVTILTKQHGEVVSILRSLAESVKAFSEAG